MNNSSLNRDFNDPGFLETVKRGDKGALEELVHAYTEQLFRGALGLGFAEDVARDLVQNVWVAFLNSVPRFEGRSHIRTFLFGILYNKASEMRRETTKFAATDPIDDILDKRFSDKGTWINPPVDPETFVATTQMGAFIKDCIDNLPLSQRMAFCLREIDDHGTSDICKILDVSTTNLGVLLYRARNRLRECIERKSNVGTSERTEQ